MNSDNETDHQNGQKISPLLLLDFFSENEVNWLSDANVFVKSSVWSECTPYQEEKGGTIQSKCLSEMTKTSRQRKCKKTSPAIPLSTTIKVN